MEFVFYGQPFFYYLKGAVYFNLGEFNKAIDARRKQLEIEPDNRETKELIKQARAKIILNE